MSPIPEQQHREPEQKRPATERLRPVRLLELSFKSTAKLLLLLGSALLIASSVSVVVVHDLPAVVGLVVVYLALTVQVWVWRMIYRGAADRTLRIEASRQAVQQAEEDLERNLRAGSGITVHGEGNRIYLHPPPGGDRPHSPGTGDAGGTPEEKTRADGAGPLLALAQLWAVTHRRLDHYHALALEQSQKSFRNAQGAMAVGFALLAVCMIVAVTATTTAGSITAGSLGAVAAALAGYVAHTFVRSQETAAAHLRTYFDQPVEFSRYLAAERLVAEGALSPQQRAELLAILVRAMVAGPGTGTEETR